MNKKKKQTREERLLKKRLAERRRYERIKNDENLRKEKQEKDRLRYIQRKQDKKQLSIAEMTPRQQRIKRKQWRKNFNAYYLRKKQEKITSQLLIDNTPPGSPNDSEIRQLDRTLSPSILNVKNVSADNNVTLCLKVIKNVSDKESPSTSTSVQRRLRYNKDKEINKLKVQILNLKKINERFRKQIGRLNNKLIPTTHHFVQQAKCKHVKSSKNVRSGKYKQRDVTRGIAKSVKENVVSFLEEDQNSRLCAGKKECVVKNKIKKQKRYLSDSMINLHKKFVKEKNIQISYSSFCRLRPFWIFSPDIRSRDTCLCKLHTNVELIMQSLKRNKITDLSNSKDLLQHMTCDIYNVTCLHRQCDMCKDRVVPYLEFDNSQNIFYWQWLTKLINQEKKVRVTEKTKMRKPPLEVIKELHDVLGVFLMHCGNISGQYQAVQSLKNNLPESHYIIHMDFSENYSVKCNEEIQSYHFGGSRKQISLHTAVIYFKDIDTGVLKHQSFCTVSDCLRHDISAVWAHIIPILDFITQNIGPYIECIHFLSDSPSSQYRNKKIFHLISSLQQYQSSLRKITWNYSESGHGKGAPDGVGAAMKQAADRAVSRGTDIKDIEDFLNAISPSIQNIVIKRVTEYDIYEKDLLFPQHVNNFHGCMKMHQIIWSFDSNMLAARKLSCVNDHCLEEPILCPHGKHLGFYEIDLPPTSVRCLVESTGEISMLRKNNVLGDIGDHVQQPKKCGPKILSNVLIKPTDKKLIKKIKKEIKLQKKTFVNENLPIITDVSQNLINMAKFWDTDEDV